MENSKGFVHIITQINASGRKKMDGYWAAALDNIYDWERDELEDIIWNAFDNDYMLAQFLPKLKKHQGIERLKAVLNESSIPSDASVEIARVLYEETYSSDYIDVIINNINKSHGKYEYWAVLGRCAPSEKAADYLKRVLIESDDDLERNTAAVGILHNYGIINNPSDMLEYMSNIDLVRSLTSEDKEERIETLGRIH